MKVSIPASFMVCVMMFITDHNLDKGKLIAPLCPGNIVVEWHSKTKQKEESKSEKKLKN